MAAYAARPPPPRHGRAVAKRSAVSSHHIASSQRKVPTMPNWTQLFVAAEKAAAEIVRKYPTLTKTVLPTGVTVFTGGIMTLEAAKKWLSDNNHSHSTK